MIGYKAFDENLKCKGFQYNKGEEWHVCGEEYQEPNNVEVEE